MDTLSTLFGSTARVKLMRLFLFNKKEVFEPREVRRRSQITPEVMRRELMRLYNAGLVKQKTDTKRVLRRKDGKRVYVRKKIRGWTFDSRFEYTDSLSALLLNTESLRMIALRDRFRGVGHIKLLVLSGVFISGEDNRVDILIVGNRLKKSALVNIVRSLESEIGKELSYTAMQTDDFMYRIGMHDRFIRDILEYPHEKLIDKLNIST